MNDSHDNDSHDNDVQTEHSLQEVSVKYEWQRAYLSAMVEVEDRLAASVDLAIKTITEREKLLSPANPADHGELEVIADALANLRFLKKVKTTC